MDNMGLAIAVYTAIYCFLDIIFVLILYLPYKFNLISISENNQASKSIKIPLTS